MRNLILFFVSLLFAAVVSEITARVYLSRFDAERLRIFEDSANSSVEGIRVRKNFDQIWRQSEFRVPVHTNNIGLRERDDYSQEPIDVGFYGDSFTFGHGFAWGERYSDQLRSFLPGKTIMSFAYLNGYAPPHYYLFAKSNPGLLPKVGVLGLFLGNDLTADIAESELVINDAGELTKIRPRLREVDPRGFLVSKEKRRFIAWMRQSAVGELLIRSRALERLGFHSSPIEGANVRPSIEFDHGELGEPGLLSLRYVEKLADLFRSDGRRFLVFLIPWSFYVGNYQSYHPPQLTKDIRDNQYLTKKIQAWCEERGIEVINPIEEFKRLEASGTHLYFLEDEHWNVRGHRAAAELIARRFQQQE